METPSWLDKELVERVVRETEANPGVAVSELEVSAAVGQGENYGSLLFRVIVHLADGLAQGRRHLIVKASPSSQMMQAYLERCQSFEKETRMYEVTLPAMNKLLAKQSRPPLSAPHYYCPRPHTIIMQDLTHEGFKMAARRGGLDLAHACFALRMLARFHATSLLLLRRDPAAMDNYRSSFYSQENRDLVTSLFQPMIQSMVSEVSQWEGYEHWAAKLSLEVTVDNVVAFMQPRAGETLTLNHGDAWVNNLLFKVTSSGVIEDMRFIDLTDIHMASPVVDLHYLFYSSLWPQVLQHRSRQLLQVYHEEFLDVLRVSGEDPPGDLSNLDHLEKTFNDRIFYGLWTAAIILPIALADPVDAMDFDNWEVGAEDNARFTSPAFKDAFQKLLHHFEQKGILNADSSLGPKLDTTFNS